MLDRVTIDRPRFFDTIRSSVFGGHLSAGQVRNIDMILDRCEDVPMVIEIAWIAYMLATVLRECGSAMAPVQEGFGKAPVGYFAMYEPGTDRGRALGNTVNGDGYRFRGRGYVQITGRRNYAFASRVLAVDLLINPDRALEPALASLILIWGMTKGWFVPGQTLARHLDHAKGLLNFVNARQIVNGHDHAQEIATNAGAFYKALMLSLLSTEVPIRAAAGGFTAGAHAPVSVLIPPAPPATPPSKQSWGEWLRGLFGDLTGRGLGAIVLLLMLVATISPALAWEKFCSPLSHEVDGKFPTLGQASRLGYCGRASVLAALRFVIQPFDVRTPVDVGKASGGGEIVAGRAGQIDSETHAYQWDFRVVDLSMLQRRLVAHLAVGQFHSVDAFACGETPDASSPSPGLDLAMPTPDQVQFSLYFKPIYSRIPPAFLPYADRQCATEPDKPCNTTLWRGTYPLADVLNQWLRVRFKIKFAPSEGTLAFAFGSQFGIGTDLAFSQRTLKNGAQMVVAPTTVNQCRHALHLGVYAQGYDRAYFGSEVERAANGPSWVSPKFADEYGSQAVPPRIVLDVGGIKIR